MKVAVIDLGTNTFKLLIATILSNGQLKTLYKNKIPVKLGEGGINNNVISHTPFLRGVEAMRLHKAAIDEHKVETIYAFATSAIRSAKNGKEFVKRIKAETGIDIKVISGKKEAELIYYGVRQAYEMGKAKHLVMDIGGGSTEFVIANSQKIYWKHSFDLGAARLLERINPSEPITEGEVKKLNSYLKKELKPLFAALEKYPTKLMIGSSGSFDSMAEMIYYRFHTKQNPLNKKNYTFNLEFLEEMYNIIIESDFDQRSLIKGLAPMRVEMIVVAAVFIRYVLNKLKMEQLFLSSYSLKEGIIYKILQEEEKRIAKEKEKALKKLVNTI